MSLEDTLQSFVPDETVTSSTVPEDFFSSETPTPSNRMFTNVPQVRNQATKDGMDVTYLQPKQVAEKVLTQNPEVQKLVNPLDAAFQTIRDYSSQISEATTFESKQRLMLDLRQSAITHIEKAQEEAKTRIEASMGLPQFRQTFMNAQRIAAQNPKYAKDILTLEQQLTTMESRAQSLTAGALKANTGIQTFIKAVDGELQIQEKMASQFQQQQIKKLDRLDQQKEAASDILAGAKPEAIDTITRIFPGLQDDPVAQAKFITSHKGKEWQPILDGTITEDKYLSSALSGNQAAKAMAITQQAKLTGQSIQAVKQDVDYAESLVMNPNLLAQEMKKYGIPSGLSPDEEKKLKAQSVLGGGKKSKEEIFAEHQRAIGNVEKILAYRADSKLNDISTWSPDQSPLSDPTAQNIYESTKLKLGRKPDVVEFAKAYINEPGVEPEIKKVREQTILSGYQNNAEKSMKGIFSVPLSKGDISDRMRKIRVGITLDSIQKPGVMAGAREFGASLASVLSVGSSMYAGSGVGSFVSANDINNPSSTVNPAGTLDEFFTGLLRGK